MKIGMLNVSGFKDFRRFQKYHTELSKQLSIETLGNSKLYKGKAREEEAIHPVTTECTKPIDSIYQTFVVSNFNETFITKVAPH